MAQIKNIATAGSRCFCPGCVMELPLDNDGCRYTDCGFFMRGDRHIPTLEQLLDGKSQHYDAVSHRFFKFLVAYGRATHDHK